MNTPPPPPGFEIIPTTGSVPPPPPGFEMMPSGSLPPDTPVQTTQTSAQGDFLRSIPRGVLQGLAGVGSAGGQAAQIEMGQPVDVPDAPETTALLEKNLTGELHKPQTTAGLYGESVGEFLGNPLSYLIGPGSIPLKAGLAVTAGLGSEAGGQATKGTPYEPYGRIGGAMLFGGLGAKGLGRLGEPAAAVAPSIEEIKTAATQGYKAARALDVEIKPSGMSNLADGIKIGLERDNGISPVLAQSTHKILDTLTVPQPAGAVVTLDNFRAAQQSLGWIAKEARASMIRGGGGGAEYFASTKAQRALADYLENIPAADVIRGDAAKASDLIKKANQDYAAAMQAKQVSNRIDTAEVQTATTGSGSNLDNKIRQKISPIATNERLQYGFRPDEIEQARRVAMGTPIANLARKAGKLGFNDGLTLMAHTAAAALTGGSSIPIGIAGTGARLIAEALTRRGADRLEEMIRSRSALAQQVPASPAYIPPSMSAAISRALMVPALEHADAQDGHQKAGTGHG